MTLLELARKFAEVVDRLDAVESENKKLRRAITQSNNQVLAFGMTIEPIDKWIIEASRKIGVTYSSLYKPFERD